VISADDRVLTGEVILLCCSDEVDGVGVEIYEYIVPDDRLRRRGAGNYGSGTVIDTALKNVLRDDMLRGAEALNLRITGTEIAASDRACVSHVVADDPDEARGTLPSTAADITDTAIQHRGVLCHIVVVEGVTSAILYRASEVGE